MSQPEQDSTPRPFLARSKQEHLDMQSAINNLISLGAISVCSPCPGQFVSKTFLVPKSNGGQRFILNLKELNKFVSSSHFKMEDYRTAMALLTTGDFMAKIDLKESYLLINIHPQHRKYLRFEYDKMYEFSALPYGLCSAPYLFTKIMKVVVTHLREKGFKSVQYLDDILCIGSSYELCLENVQETIKLLQCLGFVINFDKSVIQPTQSCQYLGFVLDTNNMTLELPVDKRNNIKKSVQHFLTLQTCAIRDLAKLIGTLIAACPATTYGWLYTKILEHHKFAIYQQAKAIMI